MRDPIANLQRQSFQIARFWAFPVALLVAGLLPRVAAQEMAITHCEGKCPQYISGLTATRSNVVVHHVFAAGLNNDTGLADWVAYRLTKEAVGVASLLPRSWQPDRLVAFADAAEPIDVNSSEYSLAAIASTGNPYYGGEREVEAEKTARARLAPITSFANTPYWSDLNNLTNMVPMPNPLRLGAWLQLEQTLNELVVTEEELYVVSGPLFLINQRLSTTASAADFGPAAYYKVVVADSGLAAFVFPENLPQHASFCGQQANLRDIEQMAELILFPDRDIKTSTRLLTALGCD